MKKYNLGKVKRKDDDELFLASAVLTATPISLEKERSPNHFFVSLGGFNVTTVMMMMNSRKVYV